MIELLDILPRAVVESRWKTQQFVPEVLTLDGNFIVGSPESSHEEAMKIAKQKTEEITNEMIKTCRLLTSKLNKAKE